MRVGDVFPDEIYYLGAQSHVRVSFDIPVYTIDTVGQGTLRILESIRRRREEKEIRFYQAGSSEMFGSVTEIPQRETTPFHPRSPYACRKVLAHILTVNYRESYGLHASNGILFNHESPRRGETFVTRKITRGVAQILAGKVDKIFLGNLTAQRDWGYAKDYVEAMWLMLQQPQPDDYVVATGESQLVYSMRAAFQILHEIPAAHRALLIIGDGEESCGEDPVGVARAEAGDVAIHTISLGKRVSNQMVGIVFVTGGTYTRAFDDASFFSATKEALLAQPLSVGESLRNATEVQDSSNRLEVILDVSNSMWGQISGRTKIELARNALSGALEDLPLTVNVGFRAYGHRVSVDDKEAGCMDTERLLVPAPGNGPTVARLANRLTPRGQTPIARALRETAQDVRAERGAAVILLISDGVESCGGDPVAVAADLRASGLQVVLHTVGLGVTGQEAAALAALAEAGGGNYFNAPSGTQLLEGVGSVVRLSAELILQRDNVGSFPRNVLPRIHHMGPDICFL